MPRDVISPTSSGLKAQTGKLTASLSNRITRKLIGAELERLFLEKFKFTLGSELIANGTFASASGWTTSGGATIESGTANWDGSQSSWAIVRQDSILPASGSTVTATFTVSNYSAGILYVRAGALATATQVTANGTYSLTLPVSYSSVGDNQFRFQGDLNFVGSVDNVSVKEVTKQAPVAAFSLRKLGNVSPYAARIRRSSDNTEAQVFFDASDRVSESSVVRNTAHNLLDYSEDFGEWTVVNSVALTSNQTDPLGGQNAYLLQSTTTSGDFIYADRIELRNIALSANTNYLASVYIKQGPLDGRLRVQLYDDANSTQIGFVDVDFSSLGVPSTVASTSATNINYEAIGSDGWYRMSFTSINTTATADAEFKLFPDRQSGNDDVYVYGAQLEEAVTYESTPSIPYSEDFNDDTGGWIDAENGGTITTLSHETTNPLSGSGSLKITLTNTGTVNGYPRVRKDTGTSFKTGVKYRLSFKAKLLSGTAKADIRFGTASTNMYFKNQQVFSTDEQTYSYTETFDTLPTSGTDAIQFLFFGTQGPFELLIDDVKVEEFDPIASEYISTPVVSNDGLTFTETTLDDFVGGENLLTYSEDFSSGKWNALGSMNVSSASNITDPFGGTNSTKIVAPTGSGLKLLGPATVPSVSSGTTVTASVYVKNAGGRYVIFYLNDSTSRLLRVDLEAGTITSNSADSGTIEALANDWYRISFTRTLDTNLGGIFICPSLDGANISFEGNGSDGIYIFGAQLNTNSLKDYQKTSGSARDGNAGIVVLYNQTGGEDAIQETPAEQPLLYKEGLLVRSGSSPSMDFADAHNFEIDFLAGKSRLDSYYITDSTDDIYAIPSGRSGAYIGALFDEGDTSNNWYLSNYATADSKIYINGTELSGTSRDDLYTQSNGYSLVTHENVYTQNWPNFEVGIWTSGPAWNFTGKIAEMIFFDTNQSDNRVSIEKDINDFHNLF